MTRRSALMITTGLALAATERRVSAASAGRLKQSVARWCFSKISVDDLCRQAADMGLSGIDLVEPEDWPTLRKYGLAPAMTRGKASIPNGFNRKENHDRLEKELQERIKLAAEAKAPNVIAFSGNRRGLSDDEGRTAGAVPRPTKFAAVEATCHRTISGCTSAWGRRGRSTESRSSGPREFGRVCAMFRLTG